MREPDQLGQRLSEVEALVTEPLEQACERFLDGNGPSASGPACASSGRSRFSNTSRIIERSEPAYT